MRVLLAGTFEPTFSRNVKLVRLLQLGEHDVEVCGVSLWGKDRVGIPTRAKAELTLRAVVAYFRLIWKFLRSERADVVLVAYPGWFDMLVISPLARLRRMPVLFDVFISLHDTVVSDRQLVAPTSFAAKLMRRADRMALRSATRVIADTPAHADFFSRLADIPRERIGVVWLGANDDLFKPIATAKPVANRVLFHGTFIGLQGLETIVRAAKLLEPEGITVRLVGSGQEQETVDRLVAELQPSNLELLGLIPLETVPHEIASAALCLGIFGASDKSDRVVPNKLYECLAIGRPVLTGDTTAVRGALGSDEVSLTPVGDPEALATSVISLLQDRERLETIAAKGHVRYQTTFAEGPLSKLLDGELVHTIS